MQASAHDLAVFAAQVLQSPRTVTCIAQVEPPSRVSVRAHAGDDYQQTISHLTEVAAHQPTAPIPIMGAIDDRGELTLVDMESGKLMASVKDSLISGDAPLCMCALPSDVHETLGVFVTVHASGKAAVWTMCREPPIAMCWRAHKAGTGICHVRAWLEPGAAASAPASSSGAPGDAAAPSVAGHEPDQPCAPGDWTRAVMKRLRIITVPGHFDGERPDSRPIAAHAKCWAVDFAGATSRAMPRTPRGAAGVVRIHHNGWTPQQMWKSRTPGVRPLQVAVCSLPQAPPAAVARPPESVSTSTASRSRAISPDPWAAPGAQPGAGAAAPAAPAAPAAASQGSGSAHKHGKWGKLMGSLTKKSIHWMHGAAKAMDSKAEAAQRRTEQGVGAGMSDKLLSGMRGVTQPAVSGLSSIEQSAQAQAATVGGPTSGATAVGAGAAPAAGGPKFGMLLSNSDGRFTLLRPTRNSSAQQIDPDHEGRCALHNVAVLDLWADQELEQLHQVGAVWPTAGSVAVTLDEYTGTVHALYLVADGSAGFQLAHCYSQAGVLPAGHHSFIPLRLLIRRDGTLDTHSIPGPMWLARNNVTGAVLLCCLQCRESQRGLEPVRISTTQLGCGGTEWLKHAAETHIHAACVLDVSAGTAQHPGVLLGAEVLLAVRGVAEAACLHGHDTRPLPIGSSAAASSTASSDTTIAAESAIISADTGPGSLVFSRRILSTEQVLLAVQPPAGLPRAVGAQHELGHSPQATLAALPAEVGMAAWLSELQKQLEASIVGQDARARACKWNAWQDQAAVLHCTTTATWQQPDGSSILALQSLPAVFWPPWPAAFRWTLDKPKQRQRAELQNHATCAPGGGPALPETTSMFRHTLQSRVVPAQLATIPAQQQGLLKPGHPVAVDVGKAPGSSSEPRKYLLSELPARLGATAPAATLPATLVDGWLGALEAHAGDAVPSWLVRARREVERLLRLHAMRRQEALDEPPLLLCLQACCSAGDSAGPAINISTPWFIQTRGHVPARTLTDDAAAHAAALAGSPSHEGGAGEPEEIRRVPTPLQRSNPGASDAQGAVKGGAEAKASRWGQALGTLPINDMLQLLEHAHPELAQLPAMCNVQVLTLVPPIAAGGVWSLGVLGVSMTGQPIPLLFPLHEAEAPAAAAGAQAGAAGQLPVAKPIRQVLLPLPADMAEPGVTSVEAGLVNAAAPERATPLPSPTPEHGQPLPSLPGCVDAMQVWDVYTPGQAAVTSRLLLGPCDGTELHCWRLAPDGAWKTVSFCPFSSAEGSISRAVVVPGPPAPASAALPGAAAAMPAPGGTYLAVVSTFGKVKILNAHGHTVHHFDIQYAIPVTGVAALPVAGTLWPCLAVLGEPTRVASTSALQVVECWDIWRTQLIERWHPVHAGGVSAVPTDVGGEPVVLTHEAPGMQLEEADLAAHRTVWLCA